MRPHPSKLVHPLLKIESTLWQDYSHIAGLDEAGRGAWAGPVVAACAVFEPGVFVDGVDDSKKLTPKKRETLFETIKAKCLHYGIGMVSAQEIDEINILEASKKAMLMSLAQLTQKPDYLLVDGNMTLDTHTPQQAVIDGDALSHSIAAASILAKVTRDRLMVELSAQFPQYGFEKHKGYGTKIHRQGLGEHGVSEVHRKSYKPIQKIFNSYT